MKDHGTVRPRGFHEACVFALVWSEDDEHVQIDTAQQSVALHSFDVLDRTQFVAVSHETYEQAGSNSGVRRTYQ